jgi:hypothetical protein
MLDNDTKKFLEKIAETSDATGASQLKQRTVGTRKQYQAEGTALGGLLGLSLGHMHAPKEHAALAAVARFGGLGLGSIIGREIGAHGSTQSTSTTEGVIKKQTKEKGENAAAKIPSLSDATVLKLLDHK